VHVRVHTHKYAAHFRGISLVSCAHSHCTPFPLLLPLQVLASQRNLSSSTPLAQASLTEVPVEGADSLLQQIDRIITNEAVTAKEVSDAAVSLAYVQAKGNRRYVCMCARFVCLCAQRYADCEGDVNGKSVQNFYCLQNCLGIRKQEAREVGVRERAAHLH
jgi:hypothetical protein